MNKLTQIMNKSAQTCLVLGHMVLGHIAEASLNVHVSGSPRRPSISSQYFLSDQDSVIEFGIGIGIEQQTKIKNTQAYTVRTVPGTPVPDTSVPGTGASLVGSPRVGVPLPPDHVWDPAQGAPLVEVTNTCPAHTRGAAIQTYKPLTSECPVGHPSEAPTRGTPRDLSHTGGDTLNVFFPLTLKVHLFHHLALFVTHKIPLRIDTSHCNEIGCEIPLLPNLNLTFSASKMRKEQTQPKIGLRYAF